MDVRSLSFTIFTSILRGNLEEHGITCLEVSNSSILGSSVAIWVTAGVASCSNFLVSSETGAGDSIRGTLRLTASVVARPSGSASTWWTVVGILKKGLN